jgi:hypothetical protein
MRIALFLTFLLTLASTGTSRADKLDDYATSVNSADGIVRHTVDDAFLSMSLRAQENHFNSIWLGLIQRGAKLKSFVIMHQGDTKVILTYDLQHGLVAAN